MVIEWVPISEMLALEALYSSAKDLHLTTFKNDAFLPVQPRKDNRRTRQMSKRTVKREQREQGEQGAKGEQRTK